VAERIRSIEKSNDFIGNKTSDCKKCAMNLKGYEKKRPQTDVLSRHLPERAEETDEKRPSA
jgi:hypothetical protein